MRFSTLAVVLCASAAACAQSVREIWRAPDGASCLTMDPRCRAVAATAHGTLFLLVAEARNAPGLHEQSLRLLRSDDGGRRWSSCVEWPTGPGCEGSIVADPQGTVVHVVYATREVRADALSLAHRAWDPAQAAWVGPPTVLAAAGGPTHQYQACDLDLAADGSLFVTAMGMFDLDPALGPNPALLFVRPASGKEWSPVQRINLTPTGGSPQLALAATAGAVAYTAWVGDRFEVRLRGLDLARGTLASGEVSATHGLGAFPANAFSLQPDVDRRIHLLLPVRLGAQGELALLAHPPVAPMVVDRDDGVQGGNHHYVHFGLARGPGTELIALYSKASEQHATLWCSRLQPAAPTQPPRQLATGMANAFVRVNPFRASRLDSTLFAVACGASAESPRGRIVGVGLFPVRVTRVRR